MESKEKLRVELAKARKSYGKCGCKVYKDRITELIIKLERLENDKKGG